MELNHLVNKAELINISWADCVMILAPHPDDESLGCGGTIAMLRHNHKKVIVLFITDGCMSHPNSKKYPANRLAALRKAEAVAALKELDANEQHIFFMNKKDRHLPFENEEGFQQNTEELKQLIDISKPQVVFVPYEKDPHPDHRATWQMLMHIHRKNPQQFIILEYMIWFYNLGEQSDLPQPDAEWLFADITSYLHQKQKAIARHVSQTTRFIDDDAGGFMLTPDVMQHFNTTKEYFLNRNL